METEPERCELSLSQPAHDTLCVSFAGCWKMGSARPSFDDLKNQIDSGLHIRRVVFDTRSLTGWDSSLLTFMIKLVNVCSGKKIDYDEGGLPPGVRRLLDIATAVPEKKTYAAKERESFLSRVGASTVATGRSAAEMLEFIGASTLAMGRFVLGKAQFRRSDLGLIIQECGAQALPIVSLISLLVGLILAFVGAVQLKLFGAQIYVADMVGIAMVREMGAMMTGIIMAGRTGAAFAAQLGTMQVNEEIDALTTMGISPMEFLVLPRMLALILMMPLLCLYANLMGMLGGVFVGVGMLDIAPMQYFVQTKAAVNLTNINIGLFKSVVYGVLVALSGCLRGMQCGRRAPGELSAGGGG